MQPTEEDKEEERVLKRSNSLWDQLRQWGVHLSESCLAFCLFAISILFCQQNSSYCRFNEQAAHTIHRKTFLAFMENLQYTHEVNLSLEGFNPPNADQSGCNDVFLHLFLLSRLVFLRVLVLIIYSSRRAQSPLCCRRHTGRGQ